jgi:hypothetical protein
MRGRRKRSRLSENQPDPNQQDLPVASWLDEDGIHALLPGTPPDQQALERMTRAYQEQIRQSPMWDEMVREFGLQKAEALLKQCRAKLR